MKMISLYANGRISIQEQGGMKILSSLSKLNHARITVDVALALKNLSRCKYQMNLIDEGCIESLFSLCCREFSEHSLMIHQCSSTCIRNLSTNRITLRRLVLEERLMPVLKMCANCIDFDTKYNTCIALHNIISNQDSQEVMIRRGIIQVIIKLAEEGDKRMRVIGSTALHQLKQEYLKDEKAIALLLDLLDVNEILLNDVETMCPEQPPQDFLQDDWKCAKESDSKYTSEAVPVPWSGIYIDRTWSTKTEVAKLENFVPQSFQMCDPCGSGVARRANDELDKMRKMDMVLQKYTPRELERIRRTSRKTFPAGRGEDAEERAAEGNDGAGPVQARTEDGDNVSSEQRDVLGKVADRHRQRRRMKDKIRESNRRRNVFGMNKGPDDIPPPGDVVL
uniref:Uncharacterized protein n=1 Tax=Corethron hystrix TaxID=216773 RepID=A0A7S1FUE7_9STRA|mmetsp:Transcript_32761/g.75400  ORF Transcript_32761/g.75400 Transcript_32761/m.75400 type:complete len:394 (+) Transcript_32761:677-1858(+)